MGSMAVVVGATKSPAMDTTASATEGAMLGTAEGSKMGAAAGTEVGAAGWTGTAVGKDVGLLHVPESLKLCSISSMPPLKFP